MRQRRYKWCEQCTYQSSRHQRQMMETTKKNTCMGNSSIIYAALKDSLLSEATTWSKVKRGCRFEEQNSCPEGTPGPVMGKSMSTPLCSSSISEQFLRKKNELLEISWPIFIPFKGLPASIQQILCICVVLPWCTVDTRSRQEGLLPSDIQGSSYSLNS